MYTTGVLLQSSQSPWAGFTCFTGYENKQDYLVNKPLWKLYKLISSTDFIIPLDKWKKDLNIHPNNHLWKKIWNNIFSMSRNTNERLIQYKIIHRTHITRHKMHIIGFTGSDMHSMYTVDTTADYLWLCPTIHFWKEVTTTLSLFLGCSIPLYPSKCIQGDLDNILSTCSAQIIIRN